MEAQETEDQRRTIEVMLDEIERLKAQKIEEQEKQIQDAYDTIRSSEAIIYALGKLETRRIDEA